MGWSIFANPLLVAFKGKPKDNHQFGGFPILRHPHIPKSFEVRAQGNLANTLGNREGATILDISKGGSTPASLVSTPLHMV